MNKKVIVKDGVNTRTGELIVNNGDYFSGDFVFGRTEKLDKHSGRMWNIVLINKSSGERYNFLFASQMTIGRIPPSDERETRLVLSTDVMVSKVHAIIYGTDNTLAIADNQSKNHTYVNGERITMPHVLNPGDVIRVGRTEFQVTYGISFSSAMR